MDEKKGSRLMLTCAPCFSAIRRTAFAGHQRRLFPIEEPFVGGFDRIGVNE